MDRPPLDPRLLNVRTLKCECGSVTFFCNISVTCYYEIPAPYNLQAQPRSSHYQCTECRKWAAYSKDLNMWRFITIDPPKEAEDAPKLELG